MTFPSASTARAAVGVAVVRDAEVCADLDDLRLQRIEVRRAGALVDVEPVRVRADDGDPRAGILERLRGDARGSAVRAVDDDVQPGERVRERAEQVDEIAVLRVGEAADPADRATGRAQLRLVERGLDPVLDDVGELHAAAREELDAVVWRGVVRRGDHHPEVGGEVPDEERERRGREHAGVEHVHPGAREPGRDGRREELPTDPGVAGDDGDGPATLRTAFLGDPALAEHDRGGLREAHREVDP